MLMRKLGNFYEPARITAMILLLRRTLIRKGTLRGKRIRQYANSSSIYTEGLKEWL
jgi:hypothetical protein